MKEHERLTLESDEILAVFDQFCHKPSFIIFSNQIKKDRITY